MLRRRAERSPQSREEGGSDFDFAALLLEELEPEELMVVLTRNLEQKIDQQSAERKRRNLKMTNA